MKEYLFQVSIRHKQTKEKIKLYVWAKNVDEATHNLCGTLIGYNCEYEWCGSSPVYKNNKNVMREITK